MLNATALAMRIDFISFLDNVELVVMKNIAHPKDSAEIILS